jgi:hypothetical protein
MAFPIDVGTVFRAIAFTVAALAGGFVGLFIFYAMGERLTVLVDIERNTRPPNVEGKRYWALPLLAFVCDLMGLLWLLAGLGVIAWIWLTKTGVLTGALATQPAG